MKLDLTITRKTYYALGMVGVALSMAGALFVLFGQAYALLDNIAFALTGLMFLFLAAVKGSAKIEKTRYFLCFMLLLFGVVPIAPAVNRVLAAACWPVFLWYEQLRQGGVRPQAAALTAAETVNFALWLLVAQGGLGVLAAAANLLWLATTVVRGWAILSLYKRESARQAGQG